MPLFPPSGSPFSSIEEIWTMAFNELHQRIRYCFTRQEPWYRALAYVQGLMSSVERKNGWQVAEAMGEVTPYAMQHLLDRAKWDCDEVRDALRAYIVETLATPNAVLVVDETGFLKKGTKSVGVQRQYSGTAGRIENCQVGVFLTYASTKGHTLLDRELYLPKSWTQDSDRCRAADVPEEVSFATKPELAARMLWRHLDAGLEVAWVTGDTVYGSAQPLRAGLEGVCPSSSLQRACGGAGNSQASRSSSLWIEEGGLAGAECRHGEQRTASLRVGARRTRGTRGHNGWQRWLLVRQSLDQGSKPTERAYVLVFAPAGTTLQEMVEAFGTRWAVEQCFEEGKGEVGLDEYEVRSWHGWFRHITLSMLAMAFLAALRANGEEDALKKSLSRRPRCQN